MAARRPNHHRRDLWASTPDRAVADVLDDAFRLKDPKFQGIAQDPVLSEAAIASRGKQKAH